MSQLTLALRLRERAVFDSFVVGPNAAAVEQLQTIAAGSIAGMFWLSGPSGVGKSHLLQAVCALARERETEAAYLSLAQLQQFGPEALDGWHSARIVAIDELARVAGERTWEQKLFGLYRELEERAATLIAAAADPPRLLNFALPDLASRYSAATLITLRALDETAQREALRVRAQARGLELPEETALYLQRRFPRDLPTLYELFDRIDDAAFRAQRRLTVPFIREVLSRYLPGEST
ncbi:MAG TPA: DnaA regulatory inactivator Hda [Steroidobacteraceae bacterium]|nr:DnaA regulatory inactivator Hda [Steroidobacteraceae bacterium]